MTSMNTDPTVARIPATKGGETESVSGLASDDMPGPAMLDLFP